MSKPTAILASRLICFGSARAHTNAVIDGSQPELDNPPLRFD